MAVQLDKSASDAFLRSGRANTLAWLETLAVTEASAILLAPLASAGGVRLSFAWLKEWQTLVAGVLAIVAAVIGGLFIWRQTQETIRLEAERLRRSANGARSVLPLVLNDLVAWTEEVVASLKPILLSSTQGLLIKKPMTVVIPAIPRSSVTALQQVIEVTDGKVGEAAARALARAQVVLARLSRLPGDLSDPGNGKIVTRHDIESLAIETARVKATLESLFDYARADLLEGRTELDTADRLSGLLHRMGLDEMTFPTAHDLIRHRFPD